MFMAVRAGFSVLAHSSRATFQRWRAASLDGSSAKSSVRVSPRWSGSLRETVTEGSLDGSSQPDSSHVAIAAGGSGGEGSDGCWTLLVRSPAPASSILGCAAFSFVGAGFEVARLIDGDVR